MTAFPSLPFRPAPLPDSLSGVLGDFHLLLWIIHHRHPHCHSNHLQTLLCPEEERLQQPVSCPEISQEHSSEETGNTPVCVSDPPRLSLNYKGPHIFYPVSVGVC